MPEYDVMRKYETYQYIIKQWLFIQNLNKKPLISWVIEKAMWKFMKEIATECGQ